MRSFLLAFIIVAFANCPFLNLNLAAQPTNSHNNAKIQINPYKLAVQFALGTSLAQQKQILCEVNGLLPVQNHTYLQHTGIVVVKLNPQLTQAQTLQTAETLIQNEKIIGVNEILRDASSGGEVGLLNQVFFRILTTNANAKPNLTSIQQHPDVLAIVPHQYLPNVYTAKLRKHAFNAQTVAAYISRQPNITWAEPNYLLTLDVHKVNDPLYKYQWAHKNDGSALQYNGTPDADMDIEDAWFYTMGDPNIKVAVLDSGVDTNHIDLVGNLLPGYDATGGGTKGYPSIEKESDAHGTACAGIIAAKADNNEGVAGIAPNCKIIPIRIFFYVDTIEIPGFGKLPYSTSEYMADAFGWASLTAQADVLSNSWGLPPFLKNLLPGNGGPQLVEESIAQAITAGRNGLGLPTFFSSGNVGDLPQWPMDIVTEAIAVNSSSMCDERKHPQSCDGEDWWEGNWGAGLDISAPGVKIATCDPSGSYGYESGNYTYTFNGTSSACPNAAGVMALILSVNPSLSFKQAYGLLCTHADKVGGYAYDSTATYGTWSKELGYGRINALNAVAYASITKGVDNDIAIKNNLSNLVIMPSVSGVGQNIRIVLPDENLQINNLNLCVYNVLGQIVHHQRLSSPNNNNNNNNATSKTAINIAAPSLSGLYFVVLLSEVGTPISSGKIMVQ